MIPRIAVRRVYVIRYRADDGTMQEFQFTSRQNAIVWLNRIILDAGRYDAKLVTRFVKTS